MDTERRIKVSILNDCYGELLTSHQSEMIRLYYDLDISLNEIAEQYSISRQAVRDAIMRGEKTLEDLEKRLHIVSRNRALLDGLKELDEIASDDIKAKIRSLIDIVEGD